MATFCRIGIVLAPLCALVVGLSMTSTAIATPLDDFVAAPDAEYHWELKNTITEVDYTGYVLAMVSQTWRTSEEVNRRHWIHWVIIIVPTGVTSDKAFLMIDGGSNGGNPPGSVDSILAAIAVATGTVVAQVKMIPNQPLTFSDETESRWEDALIAYT